MIDGYMAFQLLPNGNLLAGKEDKFGNDITTEVEPYGEWKSEAERLKLQQEFQSFFGSVSDKEFEEYTKLAKTKENNGYTK